MNRTAFFFIRLGVGVSMFTHGLVRLPKLVAFVEGMVKKFQPSMLPASLVKPFAYTIPFVEFLIGLWLIPGILTRIGSLAGAVLMIMLMFGTGMIEDWGSLPSQMIHLLFFVLLIQFEKSSNRYSLDHFIRVKYPHRELV